ncbi:MAG: hypothetical protein ACTHLW_02690, partial [Verrucomicrobiota bacterium]
MVVEEAKSVVTAQAKTASSTSTQTLEKATASEGQTTSSTAVDPDSGSVLTEQLTTTLKAANAPPVTDAVVAETAATATQTSNSESVTTSSAAAPAAGGSSLPGLTSGLPQYIQNELAAHTASFTADKTIGSITLSDFLQLDGVTLHFNATLTTTNNVSTWSGTVTISATSAILFPGKTFTGTISNPVVDSFTLGAAATSVTLSQNPLNNSAVGVRVNNVDLADGAFTVATASGSTTVTFPSSQPQDTAIEVSYLAQNALTGTYTIGGSYALQAKSLVLNMGEALVVGATSVNFTYNSAGTETQQLVAVSGATVTSPQFSGFGSIALSNFKLRADGFSFDSFTLSSTASPGIGNLLTASSITLNASNVDVSFGTSTTSASFSGTVTATISGLQLFPVGGFVQFQATAVTGSYGFGGFDGTSASGKLSLAITGFQLSMGEAFKIVATGTVTVTPGQTQIATIAAATLSSPQFSQLGSVSLTNLVLSQTGFSLADVSMTTGGSPAAMGDFLTFDSLSVSFKDFVFTYGSEVKVDGTVQVTPTNVILFPGISFLNLHLGDLTGTYNFGGSALLSIGIPNLDIVIGQALTIHLGHVTIQPSQSVMLHVTDATVTSNLFSGLETFKLGDFDLTQTGFTLGSFTLNALTGVTVSLGGFLEFGSVSVVVSNLTVDKTATPKISGTITTTIGNMTLFPGSSLITSSFGTVTASYDFSGSNSVGRLTFTTESFSLSIGSQ